MRVSDRLGRPESGDLHPREQERLTAMVSRADALSMALYVLIASGVPDGAAKADALAALGEMHEEAREALCRYRVEVGLEVKA